MVVFTVVVTTAQIDQLDRFIRQVDDIFEFEIPVNNGVSVQLDQRTTDLIQDSGDIADFQLDFLVVNALKQVLAFNVFHDQVDIAIGYILEVIDQLNHIVVFDPVQNLYLFLDH